MRTHVALTSSLVAAAAALAITTATPALAVGPCPNEAVRAESDVNPLTGKPYSTELPGCRAYELVSSEQNDNEVVAHSTIASLALISADGASLLWEDLSATSYAHPSNGASDVFSTQRGANGWSPPRTLAPENNDGREHFVLKAASGDLSTVLLEGAPQANEITEINGKGFPPPTNLLESGPGGCCTTIASGISGAINGGIELPRLSADGSHVYFQTEAQLLPEDKHGPINPFSEQPETSQVYEWTRTGGLRLAGVDSEGNATSPCGAGVPGSASHDLSADGSRVIFESPDPDHHGVYTAECSLGPVVEGKKLYVSDVYVREDGSKTVDVSRPPAGVSDYGATFIGASEDDSKIFFLSESQLTPDQTTSGPGHANLFEYDLETSVLRRLSVGPPGYDEADVYGGAASAIVSADGSHVYFTALGQLVPGAGKTEHENIEDCPGLPRPSCTANLYVYASGRVSFIATVGPGIILSEGNESTNVTQPSLSAGSAAVTPDGSDLVFESARSLTGYDSEGHGELYRYDAASATISCVSCSPTGEREENGGPIGAVEFGDSPPFRRGAEGGPIEQVGGLSRDGSTVFFAATGQRLPAATNSAKALTSSKNAVLDVYEWHDGVLSLISTGADTESDKLIGASPSGSDVFFATRSQLVGQDGDHAVDIYDARMEGGFPAPSSPVPCVSLATCRSMTATPPATVAPASVNVSGPGNVTTVTGSPPPAAKHKVESRSEKLKKALKQCKKLKGGKRKSCEKTAHRRYASIPKQKK